MKGPDDEAFSPIVESNRMKVRWFGLDFSVHIGHSSVGNETNMGHLPHEHCS